MTPVDLRLKAQVGAAIALTLVSVLFAGFLRFGWPDATAPQRIEYLFWLGVGNALSQLTALVAIAAVGVGFKASRTGVEAHLGDDGEKQ